MGADSALLDGATADGEFVQGSDTEKLCSKFTESLALHLSLEQQEDVKKMITEWSDVFSQHDLDLGHAKDVTHRNKLKEDTVFKERPRRIQPTMIDEVRAHLQEMVDAALSLQMLF